MFSSLPLSLNPALLIELLVESFSQYPIATILHILWPTILLVGVSRFVVKEKALSVTGAVVLSLLLGIFLGIPLNITHVTPEELADYAETLRYEKTGDSYHASYSCKDNATLVLSGTDKSVMSDVPGDVKVQVPVSFEMKAISCKKGFVAVAWKVTKFELFEATTLLANSQKDKIARLIAEKGLTKSSKGVIVLTPQPDSPLFNRYDPIADQVKRMKIDVSFQPETI